MCNCERDSEEEKEITQELADRLTDVINDFANEYHGNLLEHHMINATGASLIAVFRTVRISPVSAKDYCLWMLKSYYKHRDE